ncbi:hypothetical protein HQN89_29945 [Paenibacillus frigoriresistens]|nr:hypothetical protein [Paenibacillus frigoriresistens]
MSILQEFLCGQCAQSNKLSLEMRIALAISLKRGYQYTCSECSQSFILSLINAQVEDGDEVVDDIVPLPSPAFDINRNETPIKPVANNIEQLDLFLL